MKKKSRGCLVGILILAVLSCWGLSQVNWDEVRKMRVDAIVTPLPTVTLIPSPTPTVVIINEIHYNFPVSGVVDTYPVTTPGTMNIRTSPSFDGNSILTTAENDTEFMLLGITEDGQFFISEYEGRTVFLSTKVITILE